MRKVTLQRIGGARLVSKHTASSVLFVPHAVYGIFISKCSIEQMAQLHEGASRKMYEGYLKQSFS